MTFVHGYLLAGLALLAVPVVIHLLNRQKPQAMPFPAFRFLKLKRTTNRRKMRLQNLLLLLARLLVLTLIVLALARPQLTGARSPFSGNQPVLAVFVFDTSPSMDYTSADRSRLDEARDRAREVLGKIAPESKVRILETGEPMPAPGSIEGWLQGRSLVEGRLAGMRTRPVVETVPRLIEGGVALLARAIQDETLPQLLVVFSDRTVPSWPTHGGADRQLIPEGVQVLFVDVGLDQPRDLAIESIEASPDVVVPGGKLDVRVGVRATGGDFNTVLDCQFETERSVDPTLTRQPVRLAAGERKVLVFQRTVPKATGDRDVPVQIVARLEGSDPLLFNNTAFATVPTRSQRKLLLITDSLDPSRPVREALQAIAKFRPAEGFDLTTMTSQTAATAAVSLEKLQENAIVILHQVVQPAPILWDKLGDYVDGGGGLILIPPGDEVGDRREVFNSEGQRVKLLPGTLQKVITVPVGKPGVPWKDFRAGHPLTEPFRSWLKVNEPQVVAYWEVDASGNEGGVIAAYADPGQHPALLEKRRGRGRVLMFTVPLDGRTLPDGRNWHNYWKDSAFGLVLLDLACQDLAGRVTTPSLRFARGREVRLPLPVPAPTPPFKVTGPGLSDSETRVTWNPPANAGTAGVPLPDLLLPQATAAGNYQLRDHQDRVFSAFSLTEPFEENNLARVPLETIEAALGKDTVLPVGHDVKIDVIVGEKFAPPTELLPLVMIALLVLLAAESWLANRFYKADPVRDEEASRLRPTGELTRSRV